MMSIKATPLAEITQEAIKILYQQLGIVNTIRFINQFPMGSMYAVEFQARINNGMIEVLFR